MNDMEEEIDRIEKISYMKINNHYNSQIASETAMCVFAHFVA